jgi:hypothetical protein
VIYRTPRNCSSPLHREKSDRDTDYDHSKACYKARKNSAAIRETCGDHHPASTPTPERDTLTIGINNNSNTVYNGHEAKYKSNYSSHSRYITVRQLARQERP